MGTACFRAAGLGCWLGLASAACLQAAAPSGDAPRTVVKRGLTGEIRFDHQGVALQADPEQDLSAPILVRVEAGVDGGRTNYVVRFMGATAGTYDLSDWIVGPDGRTVPGLEPLVVRVVSDLPAGRGTDLYEIEDPPLSIRGGYRALVGWLIPLWCLVPVVALVYRRLGRRKEEPPTPPVPVPSLADQLRPLAVRAGEQTLTVAEQSRLELLLMFFWREQLGRPADAIRDVLPRLREHPEAGPLLAAVEEWLHQPGTTGWDASVLDRLLEPYRGAPAVSESELAAWTGERGPP